MATYKVEICGVNTAKLALLSETEKNELIKKVRAGDAKAREEYIKGNLRLVLSIVQRFAGNGDNLDDLFQIGCIGLMKAVDNFDLDEADEAMKELESYELPDDIKPMVEKLGVLVTDVAMEEVMALVDEIREKL